MPAPASSAGNRKGQSALWAYGISGDLPIVLLRVSNPAALDLVRQMIQAHAYWRHKGLPVDLVILSEAYAGYRHSLLDAVIGLINVGPEAKALDQPAGIFVRNVAQVPEEDSLLLQAVSRIVLSDRAGSLSEQLDRQVVPDWEACPTQADAPARAVLASCFRAAAHGGTRRDLRFFNGWGGFTTDGREYVIVLEPGVVTPAPWVNVLANPEFGSVVSESGAAYTWYRNAHEFRLTPWYNDAVSDVSGECFYLRDEESGAFWSPMPGPARGRTGYVSRHGLGYTAFEHTRGRHLHGDLHVRVAGGPAEVCRRQHPEHHPPPPPAEPDRLCRMGPGRKPPSQRHARGHPAGSADRRHVRLERLRPGLHGARSRFCTATILTERSRAAGPSSSGATVRPLRRRPCSGRNFPTGSAAGSIPARRSRRI